MSARHILTSLAVSTLLLSLAVAQTPPPASGTWTINDDTSITNQPIGLNGDLIVQTNGKLVLDNVTLTMNCGFDGQYKINVQKGGELVLMNNTTVTSLAGKWHYKFTIFGKATVTNSTIEEVWGAGGWQDAGLYIESDDVLLYCSTVRLCAQTGITVYNSSPSIVNCSVYNNSVRGILCYGSAKGEIINSSIHHNGNNGINQGDYSSTLIDRNEIFNHSFTGINIYNHSSPVVKNNTIYNMLARATSAGIFSWGEKDSRPSIENNIINKCKTGIGIDINSSAVASENTISECIVYGIAITGNATPTIKMNTISNINEYGIRNGDLSSAVIVGNSIGPSINYGIYNNDNSTPEISGNEIWRNQYGIYSTDGSNLSIINNSVNNNTNGIFNDKSSATQILNNRIFSNYQSGITIDVKSMSLIRNNTITGNNGTGIQNNGEGNATIINNYIERNTNGIVNSGSAKASICSQNIISGNKCNGITAEGNSVVRVSGNTVSGNLQTGIAGLDTAVLAVSSNTISGNIKNGLSGEGRCNLTVTDNDFSDNGANLMMRSCNGTIERNKMNGGLHGMEIYETSPWISDTNISDTSEEMEIGVFMSNASPAINRLVVSLNKKGSIGCSCIYGSKPRIINSHIDLTGTANIYWVKATKSSHPRLENSFVYNDSFIFENYDDSSIVILVSAKLSVIDQKGHYVGNATVKSEGLDPFEWTTSSNGSGPWRLYETETFWMQNKTKQETWKPYKFNITTETDSYPLEPWTFQGNNRTLVFDYKPVVAPIPAIVVEEDRWETRDLSKYLIDPDNDVEELKVTLVGGSGSGGNISLEGKTLSLFYPRPASDDVLLLGVSDGIRATPFSVRVDVCPRNDPPQYVGNTTIMFYEDVPGRVDIGANISDEDSPLSEFTLIWENRCSDYINQSNLNLTFTYPDGIFCDTVVVTIKGANNTQCIVRLFVSVIPVNDPPEILALPDLVTDEDTELKLDLTGHGHDEEDSAKALTWRAGNVSQDLIEITIDEQGFMIITPLPDRSGNASFTLFLRDRGGLESVKNLTVRIRPVNDPPYFNGTPPMLSAIAGKRRDVFIRDRIIDPDGPSELVRIEVNSTFVRIKGDYLILDYPANWSSGEEKITLTLIDTGGASREFTDIPVNITVMKPVKDPPYRYPIEIFVLLPIAILGGAIAILAFRRYKYGWYEFRRAFLVYQDGRMLAHYGERADADDEMLVSSMLTAVQQFIEEAMKKEQAGPIQEFQYKDMKIAVEKGKRLFLAVILKGYTTDSLRKRMKEIVLKIETQHEKDLKEWDGRMTKLPLIKEAEAELRKISGSKP